MITNEATLAALALGLGGLCVVLLAVFVRKIGKPSTLVPVAETDLVADPSFLFSGNTLIDATPRAERMLALRPEGMTDLQGFLHLFSRQFPGLSAQADALQDGDTLALDPADGAPIRLHLSRTDDLLRARVADTGQDTVSGFARLERDAMQAEIDTLRDVTRLAPQLMWQQKPDGAVLWANPAYLAAADRLRPAQNGGTVWPGAPVFADLGIPAPLGRPAVTRRHAVTWHGDTAENWFDVTSIDTGDTALHYACDANAAVRAEQAKQAFMQTLSKTFAQLSIGLAIFDKRRQLTLFNPAIQEMTGLPIAFLSGRPTLNMVFDRLREMRKLPEPRDYSSWREQFSALEAKAKNGTYSENWDLPDGLTFRVTGRPHPDGAIAFLFEDISAEISLTRHFRKEIETGHAVLDNLPDAIAVFSTSQTLVMANRAYEALWNDADAPAVATQDLSAALRRWKASAAPTRLWKSIEDFANRNGDRSAISEGILLLDGRQATCHATPLPGGMTMVRFVFSRQEDGAMPRLVATAATLRVGER